LTSPRLPLQQTVLALLLVGEVVIFSAIGTNFWSIENAFEIVRLVVEIGLLALALTPVIVTGGIDLSVGSLMGLSAVLLGMLWRDAGLPVWLAALAAIGVGVAAGGLNALVITRLGIPPLIVTLGSYSLFRGLAEGITGGVANYTDLPASFLFLGQGYFLGGVPAQLPVFALAAVGFWLLLHRTIVGRGLSAIGYSPDGARYAGLPVERWTGLTYLLSGAAAGLAAVVYVAHLGQAKSDAGTGYELAAITAVVLGGTSIFGGRGSVPGTVLGLFAIAVLQNGLRMANLPAELTGVLTGLLLLVTIGADRLLARAPAPVPPHPSEEAFDVKNSQVAVLSGVILAAAVIVAGSNWYLVKALREAASIRVSAPAMGTTDGNSGKPLTVAMMPKSKGNAYFIACRKGAKEAAQELGITLLWDGPTDPDPAKQNEVVDAWITRGVDVIAVAVENSDGLSTVLRKARSRGIKVLTWDADARPDARDFFVNQATPEGIANALTDEAARLLNGTGEFAIITGALSAANQNEWIAFIKKRQAEKYPNLKLATIRPSDDDRDKAFAETQTIMRVYPSVKLVMAISAPAVPGSAEAVRQTGRKDVNVIGLSLPNINKPYVHGDVVQAVILWNTRDLGYLTVLASSMFVEKKFQPGAGSIQAGRLGTINLRGSEIVLGAPLLMNKANIDKYDF
jgi:rhamnose transport system permease protein